MNDFAEAIVGWKRSFFVLLVAMPVALICASNLASGNSMDAKSLPGDKASDGKMIAQIIARAEKIDVFTLQGAFKPSSETGPDLMAGYYWTARGSSLDASSAHHLINLLFDKNSYQFGTVKKCPFIPEYGFRFHRGTESIDVLLSFNCQRLAFVHGGTRRIENIDPVMDRLKKIINTVFRTQ